VPVVVELPADLAADSRQRAPVDLDGHESRRPDVMGPEYG
jgi:hypothetical protein